MDRPLRLLASRPWILLGLVATLAAADAQSDSAHPPAPPPALELDRRVSVMFVDAFATSSSP